MVYFARVWRRCVAGMGLRTKAGRDLLVDNVREAGYYVSIAVMPMLLSLMIGPMLGLPTDRALSIGIGLSLASGVCAALMWRVDRRRRRQRKCMWHYRNLIDRVHELIHTIPRRTEAETLAVIHEVRNCYTEAFELKDDIGYADDELDATMRANLDAIDELYDIQSGSLRRTDANAADFADAMRRLGRGLDGTQGGA